MARPPAHSEGGPPKIPTPMQYSREPHVVGDTPAGNDLRQRLGRMGVRRLINRARVRNGRRPV